MYPVRLNLEGKDCLVVGGGGVALRKVDGLLVEDAKVTVVATEVCGPLQDLHRQNRITLEQRSYRVGEAKSYDLVFAATDDRETNQQVFDEATAARIWVNVADEPERCSFHLPARVERGDLQLAIGSAGNAPFAVRRLRQMLEQRFGQEWAEWMEAAARFRNAVRDMKLSRDEQEERYDRFFGATVDSDRLLARVPRQGEEETWLDAPAESHSETPQTEARSERRGLSGTHGLVSLIGSGPGDPGLFTVRGLERVQSADAVVYDRLAETVLPTDLDPHIELHCVGKLPGRHPVPQNEINALLVRLAQEGKAVARLKGGDPFVFGRGGEEAEALAKAEIPFEVVPCVTAGIAVPAYAGIPVTQRGEAIRVTMVTAHEAIKSDGPQVRWDLLAADEHVTLVGYMGVTSLPAVVEQLLAAGMDPETPAAMIERGTTSKQRVVKSSVKDLPQTIAKEAVQPPALFVIGPTVRYAEQLDWRTDLPLQGHRIGCVGPCTELAQMLAAQGAEMVTVPLPITPAARIVIGALPMTDWVLTRPEEAQALDDERDGPGWSSNMVTWCLTKETASEARRLGWRHVEEVDAEGSLVETIAQR